MKLVTALSPYRIVFNTSFRLKRIFVLQARCLHHHHHHHLSSRESESESALVLTDPIAIYRGQIATGSLEPDQDQYRAIIEIQKLYERLIDYEPPIDFDQQIDKLHALLRTPETTFRKLTFRSVESESAALVKVLTDQDEIDALKTPQGLMLYGNVGCGKSMLADMLSACLPIKSKKRYHYNHFMQMIYARIFSYAMDSDRLDPLYSTLHQEVVLLQIARELMQNSTILFLDEFMLPDIAAAKIVNTLFTYYFKLGGVLITTSNRQPEELYSGRFQRDQFEPFYHMLKKRCISFDLRSNRDWRQEMLPLEVADQDGENLQNVNTYFLTQQANKYKECVQDLGIDVVTDSPGSVEVYGRSVAVPYSKDGFAVFDFSDLCGSELGPADFITISASFHTIVLDNVPVLTVGRRDEARRFITLLDALYESRTRLVIRAEAGLDDLFFPETKSQNSNIEDDSNSAITQEMFAKVSQELENPYRPNVASYDEISEYGKGKTRTSMNHQAEDPSLVNQDIGVGHERKRNIDVKNDYTKLESFFGQDEQFAYKRAVSRLREMTQSGRYWSDKLNPWKPLGLMGKNEKISNQKYESSFTSSSSKDDSLIVEPLSVLRNKNLAPPPRIAEPHFWSMGLWGSGRKRKDSIAREWVKGVAAYIKKQ